MTYRYIKRRYNTQQHRANPILTDGCQDWRTYQCIYEPYSTDHYSSFGTCPSGKRTNLDTKERQKTNLDSTNMTPLNMMGATFTGCVGYMNNKPFHNSILLNIVNQDETRQDYTAYTPRSL